MPFAVVECVLTLLVVVESSGPSWGVVGAGAESSPLIVDVEVERLNPLVKGAR